MQHLVYTVIVDFLEKPFVFSYESPVLLLVRLVISRLLFCQPCRFVQQRLQNCVSLCHAVVGALGKEEDFWLFVVVVNSVMISIHSPRPLTAHPADVKRRVRDTPVLLENWL